MPDNLMNIELRMRYWQASVQDKRISQDVATQHSNDISMGHYLKHLAPRGARYQFVPAVKAQVKVVSGFNRVRRVFKDETLAYADGIGTITSEHYETGMERINKAADDAISLTQEFIPLFPDFVLASKDFLNGAWVASDYPDPSEIASRYSIQTQVLPFPEASHLNVQGRGIDLAQLQEEAAVYLGERVKGLLLELYGLLNTTLAELGSKLSSDKNLRQVSISNTLQMLDRIAALNPTNDATLAAYAEHARKLVESWNADTLNASPVYKASALASLSQITATMQSFV